MDFFFKKLFHEKGLLGEKMGTIFQRKFSLYSNVSQSIVHRPTISESFRLLVNNKLFLDLLIRIFGGWSPEIYLKNTFSKTNKQTKKTKNTFSDFFICIKF